jgi:hypothetical protein
MFRAASIVLRRRFSASMVSPSVFEGYELRV